MRQFIPVTDDLLYRAGGPPGPLVPYRCGVACAHAERAVIVETQDAAHFAMSVRQADAVTAPGCGTSAASACP